MPDKQPAADLDGALRDYLNDQLERREWTLADLRRATGIPYNTLRNHLEDDRRFPLAVAAKITAAFGKSLSAVIAEIEGDDPPAVEPWRVAFGGVLAARVGDRASVHVRGIKPHVVMAAIDADPIVTIDQLWKIGRGMGVPDPVISQYLDGATGSLNSESSESAGDLPGA